MSDPIDRAAVASAVAYRMQAAWAPGHERIVNTVVSVIESGEWREFADASDPAEGVEPTTRDASTIGAGANQ